MSAAFDAPPPSPRADPEPAVARLLGRGTAVAILLAAAGVAGMAVEGIDPLRHATAPPFDPAALPGMLLAGRPAALLQAAVAVVLVLPVVRVAAAGLLLAAAGERRLAAVAALLLVLLAASVVVAGSAGGAGG